MFLFLSLEEYQTITFVDQKWTTLEIIYTTHTSYYYPGFSNLQPATPTTSERLFIICKYIYIYMSVGYRNWISFTLAKIA